LFDRAMKLIPQRYPDWKATRLDRKEITISECLDMLICFASDELDAYKLAGLKRNSPDCSGLFQNVSLAPNLT
jgi:hypothetical protein